MTLPNHLCERIHEGEHPLSVWREHRKLDLAQLSKASGYSEEWLGKVERGEKHLTRPQAESLAKALAIHPIELMQPQFGTCAMEASYDD